MNIAIEVQEQDKGIFSSIVLRESLILSEEDFEVACVAMKYIHFLSSLQFLDVRGYRFTSQVKCAPNLGVLVIEKDQCKLIRFWGEKTPDHAVSLQTLYIEGIKDPLEEYDLYTKASFNVEVCPQEE